MKQDNKKIRKIMITLLFFLLAGLCEIGGGYLVWLWLREDMSWTLGAIGGFILFLYGIVPTFQPSYFHRIYAAYGGIFIVMDILEKNGYIKSVKTSSNITYYQISENGIDAYLKWIKDFLDFARRANKETSV